MLDRKDSHIEHQRSAYIRHWPKNGPVDVQHLLQPLCVQIPQEIG